MANKSITMSNVRQIIKLHSQGMGKKKIGWRLGMSKNTVKLYIEQFYKLSSTWEELRKLTDFELNKLFHPPQENFVNERLKQLHDYFPVMEKQLRRRGMTKAKQFQEFKSLYPDSYRETSFYHYYRLWCKKVYPSMHIEHKVADKMYVDYAGATLPYVRATRIKINSPILIKTGNSPDLAFTKAVILLYENTKRIFRSNSGSPNKPQKAPLVGGYSFTGTDSSHLWL